MSNEFDVSLEPITLESGQVLHAHAAKQCVGEYCALHNPMPGPWDQWPRLWRQDRHLLERVCPHGVGHPAVEQLEWWKFLNQEYMWIHGCCGCPCHPSQRRMEGTEDVERGG